MENIKYRAMDLFRYAFPGIFLMGVFSLTVCEIRTTKDIFNVLMPLIDVKNGILILFLGYFLGFCTDPLGRAIHNFLNYLLPKGHKVVQRENASSKYVQLIHYSPDNYSTILIFNQIKGMAWNFAVGTICLIFISIWKPCQYCKDSKYDAISTDWYCLAFFAFLLTFSLLYWAHRTEKESVNNLNAAIKMLNLNNQTRNNSENPLD